VPRKHLGGQVIFADRNGIQINLVRFGKIDVVEFMRALNSPSAQSGQ
jgi:hypothetical protein